MEAPENSSTIDPISLFNQGNIFYRQGQLKKALKCFQDAANIVIDQPKTLIEVNLRISRVLLDEDQVEESARLLDRTLDICRNNFEEDDPIVAKVYISLSRTNRCKRKNDIAYEQCLKALTINVKKLDPNDIQVGRNHHNMGICLRLLGKYEDATVSLKKALEIMEMYTGEDRDLEIGITYRELGNVCHNTIKTEEATKYLETSLKLLQAYYPCNHPDINCLYDCLAGHYFDIDNIEKAHEYYKILLESCIDLYGKNHSKSVKAYKYLGRFYYETKDYEASEENLLNALKIFKNTFGEDNVDVAVTYITLAKIRLAQKKFREALNYNFQALKFLEKSLGSLNGETRRAIATIELCMTHLRFFEEALAPSLKLLLLRRKAYGTNHYHYTTQFEDVKSIQSNIDLYQTVKFI